MNLLDYLQYSKVLACGGTWVAKSALISEGKFDQILRHTKEAVSLVETAKQSL
jgi:2-dehydro-3-deoxyphosphogluconate aldolase/(4S)-4-hydroxy-2-oxoglutarate aldolase